jgi:hypothetical protein
MITEAFTAAAPPLRCGTAAQRTLHLIDIENLLGGAEFSINETARLADEYWPIAGVRPGDQTVLASSHHAARAAWFGWPDARRLVRSGKDGADLALVDVMLSEDIYRRFERVVVASGDGVFSGPCSWLQQMGCSVTVVSQPGALSRRLALAVGDVRLLQAVPEGAPSLVAFRSAA